MRTIEEAAQRAHRANLAKEGRAYPLELWEYIAGRMAEDGAVFGTSGEAARAVADDPALAAMAGPGFGAAEANAMQEALLRAAAGMPQPRLSGTVLIGAEVFRDDPFQRYTHLAEGGDEAKVDRRIGWFSNDMAAGTYAVDDAGRTACAAVVVSGSREKLLARFVREIASDATEVVMPRSFLLSRACEEAGIPCRQVDAASSELDALHELRSRVAPILLEATKGAELAYVDGNLRWFSLTR